MEALLAILLGLGMLVALRPRPQPRRALLPAEAEAHRRRGKPDQLADRVAHVEALTTAVREAPGAGLAVLQEAMADPDATHAARGALLWLRLETLDVDEAAYVLRMLLDDADLRTNSLHAALELAADGNPLSSRRLLDMIDYDPDLATTARPLLWALLVAGPYDIECRAIARLGAIGDSEDAQDLLRHFGAEPELYDRVRGAVRAIRDRNGAHGLSIVNPEALAEQGRLSVTTDDSGDPSRIGGRPSPQRHDRDVDQNGG